MKTRSLLFLFFLSALGTSQSLAGIDLVGRWVSTSIDRKTEHSIIAGWTITFRADGTFTEEIDEGFCVVEVWSGKYRIKGTTLSMHRSGYKQARVFSFDQNQSGLNIIKKWDKKIQYVVILNRSDEENPALAKQPRLPKSKSEAVAVLKQVLDKNALGKLAQTPKNELPLYHFGLGTYIRNAFGLWGRNKDLLKDLTHGKPAHPDDLSGIIIEALWEDLQEKKADDTGRISKAGAEKRIRAEGYIDDNTKIISAEWFPDIKK